MEKKAYLQKRLEQYTQLKYSAICFYHWKQLYNHVMTEKATRASKFLELSIPAIHRGLKRSTLA